MFLFMAIILPYPPINFLIFPPPPPLGGQGGGIGGDFPPPQPPISYLVTYKLFETLMYCVSPPPRTQTRGHLCAPPPHFSSLYLPPPLCLCVVVGNLTVPEISVGKLPGGCVGTLQGPYKTAICRNFAYASTTPPTMRGKKNGAVRQTLERSSLFYVVL